MVKIIGLGKKIVLDKKIVVENMKPCRTYFCTRFGEASILFTTPSECIRLQRNGEMQHGHFSYYQSEVKDVVDITDKVRIMIED